MGEINILDDVVCYAVRYCLDRLSYANSDGIRIVRHYWRHLSEREQRVIITDIREAIAENEERDRWYDDQLTAWKQLLEELDHD